MVQEKQPLTVSPNVSYLSWRWLGCNPRGCVATLHVLKDAFHHPIHSLPGAKMSFAVGDSICLSQFLAVVFSQELG